MIQTIFYTLLGVPTGYVLSTFTNDAYNIIYNTDISNNVKYNIIVMTCIFGFLKGYTGNDLVTNILSTFC
jgi:hypothetical protein